MDTITLRKAAQASADRGGRISLVHPQGWLSPERFPRGEALCVNCDGDVVKSYDASKIIEWLDWVAREPHDERSRRESMEEG